MGGVANGRLIVRNSHHWGRRRRPERPKVRSSEHPTPVSRNLDTEMRPAKDIRSVQRGNRDVRAREPIVSRNP